MFALNMSLCSKFPSFAFFAGIIVLGTCQRVLHAFLCRTTTARRRRRRLQPSHILILKQVARPVGYL